MDIIVSLWCLEQRRGYFGLTCDRYTMGKGTALLECKSLAIIIEVYSFN